LSQISSFEKHPKTARSRRALDLAETTCGFTCGPIAETEIHRFKDT